MQAQESSSDISINWNLKNLFKPKGKKYQSPPKRSPRNTGLFTGLKRPGSAAPASEVAEYTQKKSFNFRKLGINNLKIKIAILNILSI